MRKQLYLNVALPVAKTSFTYQTKTVLPVGQVVVAPFRNKLLPGVVIETEVTLPSGVKNIKPIHEVLNFIIDPTIVSFIQWIAAYTVSPLGLVAKMLLVSKIEKMHSLNQDNESTNTHLTVHYHPPVFSEEQKDAATLLTSAVKKESFQTLVLDGVTGSGKTEVYFHAVDQALQIEKNVLILLPEINLSSAWLNRFEQRFKIKPLVWHSRLSIKKRQDNWNALFKTSNYVMVGTRSALVLPHTKLGLIVVDEAHDQSFKQETQVIYSARDMALKLAQLSKCPAVLSSATPSLETWLNIKRNRYTHIQLKSRHKATRPSFSIIDLKKTPLAKDHYLTAPLKQRMKEVLERKEQVLLFINRRGYAPTTLCTACGSSLSCPLCDVSLTYHKSLNRLLCHCCNHKQILPTACSVCEQEDTFRAYGPGVEKVAEEATNIFPDHTVQIMTSDTLSSQKKAETLFNALSTNEAHIVVATQSMSKGHHFPNITLVAVLDANFEQNSYDPRSTEQAFQLLEQVAGRAGRGAKKGEVYIQSYQPDHYALKAVIENQRDFFVKQALLEREELFLPPFSRLSAIIISGPERLNVRSYAYALKNLWPDNSEIKLLGPSLAPISKIQNKERWRFLLISKKEVYHQQIIKNWLSKNVMSSSISIKVDIDPLNFS